jgi:hypothetical protein
MMMMRHTRHIYTHYDDDDEDLAAWTYTTTQLYIIYCMIPMMCLNTMYVEAVEV